MRLLSFPVNIVTKKCEGQIKCAQSWQILISFTHAKYCLIISLQKVQLPSKQHSILPPRRKLCIHKIWSSVLSLVFWATKINREQQLYQTIFFKHLYNGRCTQLTCMGEACQAIRQSSVLMKNKVSNLLK